MQPDFEGHQTAETRLARGRSRQPSNSDISGWRESNLTRSQQLIWLAMQLHPGAPLFNMIHASKIHGALDPAHFSAAFQAVVDASDALRTTIKTIDGIPQQQAASSMPSQLELVDLVATADPEIALQDWIESRKLETFDPAERLFSSALIKLSDTCYVWFLNQSHLIADAASFALIFEAVANRYKGSTSNGPADVPELPAFADYIHHERQFVQSPAGLKARDYWSSMVAEDLPPISLYDTRPGRADGRIRRFSVDLGATRSAALRELAASRGFASLSPALSMSSLWSTIVGVMLHRLAGESALRIGTPFQARPTDQFKQTVGNFVEVGVQNLSFDADATFVSVYQQILRDSIKSLRFAQPGISSAEMNRAYSVRLNYVTATFEEFAGHPVTTDWIHPGSGDDAHGLQIQVCDFEATGQYVLYFDVHDNVFDASHEGCIERHLKTIVDALLADSGRSIGSFDLLSGAERHRLVASYNDTDRALSQAVSVVTMFEEQAHRSPAAAALSGNECETSYEELAQRVRRMCHSLISAGARRGERVAICMHRGGDVVAAMLAVMKSGAAFCPIDPAYPETRKRELLDDLEPLAVIVDDPDLLPVNTGENCTVFTPGSLDKQTQTAATAPSVVPDDVAYLIYTSGSTGRPKAAMLSHAGLVNYIAWAADTYTDGEPHDFALYSSLAFDLTLTSIFVPLVTGGRIRLYPEDEDAAALEVLDVFRDDAVDVVKLTPSHLELVLQRGIEWQRISKLIVGGEEFSASLAQRAVKHRPAIEIYNEYGPTEATVGCMIHRYDPAADSQTAVPIGVPAANMRIYVRDRYGQPTPEGVSGEIVIGGPGVALGYWNRRELTREKFSIDPDTGERLYRSGDLARWEYWGVRFLGRSDDQVKVRGVRVELGELENRLIEHPEVNSAAVVLSKQRGDNLAAYFVSPAGVGVAALKEYLEAILPEHLVPTFLIRLDEIPLTPNGKVDKTRLPDPRSSSNELRSNFVAASTPVERQLVTIWQDVTGIGRIGINDNFFELGGDSVMCIQIAARAQDMGIDIAPRSLFLEPTVRELANLAQSAAVDAEVTTQLILNTTDVERIRSSIGEAAYAEFEDIYPLTPTQTGMLYHCLSTPHRSVYVGQVSGAIEGWVDLDKLREAYQLLVDAHPALRTRFFWQGLDDPLQAVCGQCIAAWHELDWRQKSGPDFERDLELLKQSVRDKGFDLAGEPPLNLTVVRASDTETHVIWTTHHVLFDGWSAYPLFNDWMQRYEALNGNEVAITAPRPFRDYVAWLQGQDSDESRKFWEQHLDGLDGPTLLPIGSQRAASENRDKYELALGQETTARLETIARHKQVTLNALFQAAWAIVLARYCDSNDVVFGMTHSGRNAELTGVDRMIGLFINTLPVRLTVDDSGSFEDWLPDIQQQLLAISEFEFSSLAEAQHIAGQPSDQLLFDSIVVFENYPSDLINDASGIELGALSFTAPSHYPLAVLVYPEERMKVHFIFDDARFTAAEMSRLGGHLQTLLDAIARNPGRPIREHEWLQSEEASQISAWSLPIPAAIPALPVHALIDRAGARQPESIAVACGDNELSYSELIAAADNIACSINDAGLGKGSLVGIEARRTPATVAGILGILKAGAAFVPVDPANPESRAREVVSDAGIELILSDGRPVFSELSAKVSDISRVARRSGNRRPESQAGDLDELAYVLFTSGTTGKPKGVMVTQHNLVHSTVARQLYYPEAVRSFLHLSSFAFDSAMAGLFWTLCDGGTLVLPAAKSELDVVHLLELLSRHRISHLLALPSFYRAILEASDESQLDQLATAIVAGEACPPDLPALHRSRCPVADLYNEYGPTEATVWSHVYRFPENFAQQDVPIGAPIANVSQHVLDSRQRPSPVGVPGELVLGGDGIARGYLGRDDLTAEKFIRLPASLTNSTSRFYRTGDRVAWRDDGSLDFLGRTDEQIKIRGYRVEPAEIGASLLEHPDIASVAVSLAENRALTAWYTAEKPVPAERLKAVAAQNLPAFMQPAHYVQVDEMPTLVNGKIDRRRLATEHPPGHSDERSYVPPETLLEQDLCDVWVELLNAEQVGIEDNFFDLGGDSITALRVAAQMHRRGWNVPLHDIVSTVSLRELAKSVDEPGYRKDPIVSIPRSAQRQRFPLSAAQQRLWFLEQMEDAGSINSVYGIYRYRGEIDADRLAWAFSQLMERHEILRTVVVEDKDQLWQQVLPGTEPDWKLEDLDDDDNILERADTMLEHRFDLSARPPWFVRLLRRNGEFTLVMVFHHVIIDGESVPVLLDELSQFYNNGAVYDRNGTALLQYGDFAAWQADDLASDSSREALDYWERELGGELPTLDFPRFRPRPARQSFRGKVVSSSLSSDTARRVRQFAESQGLSLHNVLLTAFSAALLRYCRQDEVVIGAPIGSQRHRVGAEDSLGPYINTVAIRVKPDKEWPFETLCQCVSDTSTAALEWGDVPFERVVDALDLPRDLSRTPVYQAFFAFRRSTSDRWHLPNIEAEQLRRPRNLARTDISCWVTSDDDIHFDLEFAADLFEPDLVARFLDNLLRYLAAASESADRDWSAIPLLAATEEASLLRHRGPAETTHLHRSIGDLVWSAAEASPDKVAVSSGDTSLTYDDLKNQAAAIAAGLRQQGVTAGDIVGLALQRNERLPVAILGVLEAGAAYVPLDMNLPADRLRHIVADAGLRLVVTDGEDALPPAGFTGFVVPVAELLSAGPEAEATPIDPRQALAYIMYTSGSTGLPKGVAIRHRQVVNFLTGMREPLAMTSGDVLAAITTTSFDISVLELLLPLSCGAQVHVVPESATIDGKLLAAELNTSGATLMQGTPASWRLLLESGWSGDGSLRALCGGERMPLELAQTLKRHCSRVWNLYGPTETTIWSSVAEIPDEPQSIGIGEPMQNTRIYVIDDDQALVPDGVKGQIAIAGDGVAVGYHGSEELTRKAFVDDPFVQGERMYLTGDLGRWRPDGQLEHLGRMDSQLKIRGFRIEAGDIENNLSSAPGIEAVAIAVRSGPDNDPRLVAFVVTEQNTAVDSSALREHLRDRVPAFMIPQHFIGIEQLPLTPNRKVDYQRLPEIEPAQADARDEIRPHSPAELAVARIWAELLGVESCSVTDNFFELGGHSLLAARLAGRLSRETARHVSIADVFQSPTIEKQALLTSGDETKIRARIDVAAERDNFPLTSIQQRLWFLEQLEAASGVHNIVEAWRLQGGLDLSTLRHAFVVLAEREEILRTVFVSGEGEPRQKVLAEPTVDFRFDTLDDEQELNDRLQASAAFAFDLHSRPPWFVHVIRFGNEHMLLLNFHHVLLDAESLRIVLDEVSAIYANGQGATTEPADRLQYGDFAQWQHDQAATSGYTASLEFWRSELAGELPTLRFPSFVTRPPEQTFAGDRVEVSIEPELANRLRETARCCGSTLFNVLLSAYAGVMSRYCHQDEIIVGTPVGTIRDEIGAGRSIGPYINTVALRLRPDRNSSFEQLIESVSEKTVHSIQFGNIPFEDVVRTLSVPRDLSRTPVFQTLFALRYSDDETLRLPGVTATPHPVPLTAARTDLTCWVVEQPSSIHLELEYTCKLFDRSVVKDFATDLCRMLNGLADALDQQWADVPLRAPDASLTHGVAQDVAGTIPQQVWAIADARPNRIAVSAADAEISYVQLRRRVRRVADRLRQEGVAPGDVIGMAVPRTERLPVAILGILEAGAAYLPLDLELPAERLRHILQDSAVQSVLTDASMNDRLPDFEGRLLALDDLEDGKLSSTSPTVQGEEKDLAYLMYTSGSTGLPKGVEIGHQQVVNMLQSFAALTGIAADDVLAAITTTAFDISVLELLLPLIVGGRVHVVAESESADGRKLAAEISACGASLMQGTPATWRLLIDAGWQGDPALRVLCGGEALPLSLAAELRERCRTLWNVYGPTETTVWSTIAEVAENPVSIDVGRPIHNTTVMVVDEGHRQVPVGVEGEIVIGGDGVALGYHNNAQLTAEKFIADPSSGERLYRTGDRGRWLPDGRLEHLGRLDTQLKIRGYRIEAGDVEHNLTSAAGVSKVAVTKRSGPQGDDRLVAFIVPEPGLSVDAMTLRRHLREKLPTYMIPQHFLAIDELPLTPNLKVDYRRLPQLEGQHHGKAEPRQPETPSEKFVAEIWSELLGSDDISATDNFIELGGHSLLTIRVIARIAAETGVELGPQDFFSRTLAGVAALLDANGGVGDTDGNRAPASLVARLLQRLGVRPEKS